MNTISEKNIVWYPGHMAKATRKIREVLPLIDLVIELLDARIPVSSQNPDFNELFKTKPCLTILTKKALADQHYTDFWLEKLRTDGREVMAIDCREDRNMNEVTHKIKELLQDKINRYKDKGYKNKPLRCMVAGITNVGKSTFINTYTNTRKAKVEDKPGLTRVNQWISTGNGIELLDTPGLLWHKFEDPEVGIKLAAIGSIRDDILDTLTLSFNALDILIKKYSSNIEARYKIKIDPSETTESVFEKIARKRGFLAGGNEIDEDRTSACILDELRGGKIGRITLDWE